METVLDTHGYTENNLVGNISANIGILSSIIQYDSIMDISK